MQQLGNYTPQDWLDLLNELRFQALNHIGSALALVVLVSLYMLKNASKAMGHDDINYEQIIKKNNFEQNVLKVAEECLTEKGSKGSRGSKCSKANKIPSVFTF